MGAPPPTPPHENLSGYDCAGCRTPAPPDPEILHSGVRGRRRGVGKSVTNSIQECLLIYLTIRNFALIIGA